MPAPFRHQLRVRFNECDPQGVVFNANYLVYFDVALSAGRFGAHAEQPLTDALRAALTPYAGELAGA